MAATLLTPVVYSLSLFMWPSAVSVAVDFPFSLMLFIDVASRPPHSPGFPPTLRRFLCQSAWTGPNFIPDLFLLDAQVALLKSSLIFLIVYLTSPLKCLRENSNLPQPCITYNVPLLSQWQPYYSSCSGKKSWGPEALLVHDLVSCPTGKKHRPGFFASGIHSTSSFLSSQCPLRYSI